jgi:hypothetical protein
MGAGLAKIVECKEAFVWLGIEVQFVVCVAVKVRSYFSKVSVATPGNVLLKEERELLANMVVDVSLAQTLKHSYALNKKHVASMA